MNPERWQLLKELFEAAQEKSPAERAAFLDDSCRGDPSLRKGSGGSSGQLFSRQLSRKAGP